MSCDNSICMNRVWFPIMDFRYFFLPPHQVVSPSFPLSEEVFFQLHVLLSLWNMGICHHVIASHSWLCCLHSIHLILLNLNNIIIFCIQYKSRNSSCNQLHPPVTLSLSGSNILLSTIYQTPAGWSQKIYNTCHLLFEQANYKRICQRI